MIYHQAKDPDSYQRIFYQQIGLKHRDTPAPQNDWSMKPSPFLAIDHACGGINCWRRGQHFKGVEISIAFGKLPLLISFSDGSVRVIVLQIRCSS